ncbi:hypothetical protein H9L13_04500 [Sphingomonas lutea]|uniref:Uncharacterized protein n=1 Tax=Sphingomonas lutea TaxID=1045317 RepID=A0A7G9SJX6_9SPHN|nr:hypothetical protein [Sphingomonas lutea]QNN68151.1 hypothetical protein H9L13_04500 [Sphingomonas lutea]
MLVPIIDAPVGKTGCEIVTGGGGGGIAEDATSLVRVAQAATNVIAARHKGYRNIVLHRRRTRADGEKSGFVLSLA